MAVAFISEPDKVALSKSPMDWQAAENQYVDRLRLYLFMESRLGLGDFEEVYAEERTHAQARDYPVYRFSSVADAELAYQLPPSGSNIPFLPTQVMKRCFAVSQIAFTSEANPTSHTTNFAHTEGYFADPLQPFKIYRIVADYREDYNAGNSNVLNMYDGSSDELTFFRGREWVYDGKLVEIIYTLAPFDTIRLNHDNWQVDFYEVGLKEVYALKGAWHFADYSSRNTTLPAGRNLLSTMPLFRSYKIGQEGWAWMLVENDTTFTGMVAYCKIYYADGTSETFRYGFDLGDNFGPYAIIAAPLHTVVSEAQAIASEKEMTKLNIFLDLFDQQQVNIDYDFEIKLLFDYESFAHTREFHFANSLGGTDWLIAYGKGQEREEQEAEEFRQHHQYNYSETDLFGDALYANTFSTNARQFGRTVYSSRRKFKVSAGYRSKAERDAARDLLRSEFAFIRENGKYLPINIQSAKTDFEKDGDRRYTLTFEYAYAFEEGGLRPQ